MNFFSIYIAIYALIGGFVFLGGFVLFDFFNHFFIAVALWSFIITAIVAAYCKQEEKSKELEKRIEMLEKRINMQQTNSDSFENI